MRLKLRLSLYLAVFRCAWLSFFLTHVAESHQVLPLVMCLFKRKTAKNRDNNERDKENQREGPDNYWLASCLFHVVLHHAETSQTSKDWKKTDPHAIIYVKLVVDDVNYYGGDFGESHKVEACRRWNLWWNAHCKHRWIVYCRSTKTQSSCAKATQEAYSDKFGKLLAIVIPDVTFRNVDATIFQLQSLIFSGEPDCNVGKQEAKEDEASLNPPVGWSTTFDANNWRHCRRAHEEAH